MSRNGKRIRTEHLEVRWIASLLRHPRVGFIVPKFRHGSVERNHLKRRLREAVRQNVLHHLPCVDVIIRVRPVAYDATWSELHQEILSAGQQLRASGERH
ncbi:MAG: ribonuclease P protein component [Gemmatimonadaceae bacterium]